MNISARSCVFVVEITHSLEEELGVGGGDGGISLFPLLFVSDFSLLGCRMWSGFDLPSSVLSPDFRLSLRRNWFTVEGGKTGTSFLST